MVRGARRACHEPGIQRRPRPIAALPLLLVLNACYLPPANPGYGYAPPGYPPADDPYASAYPGSYYDGGAPAYVAGGAAAPMVLYGGQWGYWDHDRQWHRAPDDASHRMWEQQNGGGGPHPHDEHPGGQPSYRPNEAARVSAPAPPQRPAPAAQPAHPDHPNRHDCPPGQRC